MKSVIIKCISVTTIITILLVLPAARSRAAWLGAIAGVAYLAWHKYIFNSLFKSLINGNKKSPLGDLGVKTRKLALVLISALIIFAGTVGLYHFKKDSADGRILIWAVTANIIKDNPLLGVGQDRFKTHYMDYQADYFRNNPDSKFGMMADDNQYAFNEPLKIWSEEGLIGLLIAAGIVFSVIFIPIKKFKFRNLNSKFQVSSSRLNSEQHESKHSEAEIGAVKPETCTLQPATIIRAAILSIIVFGMFAYPSDILPIKIVAITCLGLLSNYLALNTSNTSEASIECEAELNVKLPHGGNQTAQRSEASNDEVIKHEVSNDAAKPVTCNLNWSVAKSTERSVVKPGLSLAILLLIIIAYPKINTLKSACVTWKDAMDLYYSGLYEESLEDYEKAYPVLKHNGEYLVNYGKALSIAEKHAEAITILEQAKNYQSNSVLYNALGDSYKALEKYDDAEQPYLQAAKMSPAKFYLLYLLAKLYDASGQQQKALDMANTILNKEVKVHSTAIEEIKEEMQQIIEQ